MLKYKVTNDLRRACEIAPRPWPGYTHIGTIEAKHFKESALIRCEYTGYFSRVIDGKLYPVSSFLVDNELRKLGVVLRPPCELLDRKIVNFNRSLPK